MTHEDHSLQVYLCKLRTGDDPLHYVALIDACLRHPFFACDFGTFLTVVNPLPSHSIPCKRWNAALYEDATPEYYSTGPGFPTNTHTTTMAERPVTFVYGRG